MHTQFLSFASSSNDSFWSVSTHLFDLASLANWLFWPSADHFGSRSARAIVMAGHILRWLVPRLLVGPKANSVHTNYDHVFSVNNKSSFKIASTASVPEMVVWWSCR